METSQRPPVTLLTTPSLASGHPGSWTRDAHGLDHHAGQDMRREVGLGG